MADGAGCILAPLFACYCIFGLLGITFLSSVIYFVSQNVIAKIVNVEGTPFLSPTLVMVSVLISVALFILITWLWTRTWP